MLKSIKIEKKNIKETRNLDKLLCMILGLGIKQILTIENAIKLEVDNSTFFDIKLEGQYIELTPLPSIKRAYQLCRELQSLSKKMPKPKQADIFIGKGKPYVV